GSAELTIQPLQKRLSNIRINCRQCKITGVQVNEEKVRHSYADPVSELTLGEDTTVAYHNVYKSKYLNALREADEGELLIPIPDSCIKQISESEARLVTNDVYMHDTMTTLHDDTVTVDKTLSSTPTFAPITIRVEYTLENPRTGLIFVDPDELVAPYRYHHLYTINQPLPGATRSWLPCIDRIHDRCTWDMDFIVPNKLGSLPNSKNGEDMTDDEYPSMVVCSGEMVEQVVHPLDPSRKIVRYNLSVPTAAPFIGFAIGPFEMIKLTPSQLQEEVLTGADLDESQQQSLMAEINMMANIFAFALPGRQEDLTVSCSFLMHAMHFYAQEYGSYPFSDYKLVFVEDAWSETSSSASLTIYSSRLLHPPDIIDQTYNTRRVLSLALARQWFGIHIVQKSWPDAWLVYGLSNLMGAYFIKRHLGNSEFRLRMKRDMELCCSLDINRPPLYNPALPSPLEPEDLEFIELKAPLVLYMLDKRMCKAGATLGLSRVIPKILVSAISGELVHNALSTHYFLKLCRKVSGVDTKTFADQWIYRSGCPKFSFSFHFNRKKMVVEFYMRQENTNTCLHTTTPSSLQSRDNDDTNNDGEESTAKSTIMYTKSGKKKYVKKKKIKENSPPPAPAPAPTPSAADLENSNGMIDYQDLVSPLFTGNLTVRIHEADGTPYEHILDIQSAKHKFEVQFNTKYKRIRRNTKRFLAKQAAAAAAVAEEDAEKEDGEGGTTNVLGIIPALGLGMPVFEDPKQRELWKVVEWGQEEDDTSGAASAMFDWIRLDADFEWICTIDFQQPDYMWAGQLTKDRDVVAQYEAIEALKNMPSLPTSTSLLRALLDPKCFYKIRMEAAYALAKGGGGDNNWVGLHQLYKMFQNRYCFAPSGSGMPEDDDAEDPLTWAQAIPKPNNFSNLGDYFVQKGLVIAFSQVRDQEGVTPIRVRQLLLDLLKYNDNIGNEFSDSYYIATIISALGDAFIPSHENSNSDAMQIDNEENEQLLAAAVSEIERFRTLDCVIPTYHNIVTVSCIKALTKLMLNGMLELSVNLFLQYTRYGHYLGIRLCAFDSLFVLCGLTDNTLTEYFLSVIKDDPCPYVSHYVARAMLVWLGPAMRDKPDLIQNRFVEEFAEEEGNSSMLEDRRRQQQQQQSQKKKNDDQIHIENLRRQFENNMELQENIWRLLNSKESASLDHSIRKSLLQFCEYMYKPVDVGIKVTIRMPSLVQDMPDEEPSTPSPPILKITKSLSTASLSSSKHDKHDKHHKHSKENGGVTRPEKRPAPLEQHITQMEQKQHEPKVSTPLSRTVSPPPSTTTIVPPSSSFPSSSPHHVPSTSTTSSAALTPVPESATMMDIDKQVPQMLVPKITTKKPDGMSISDFKKCRRILGKVQRHKSALAFLQPVDEETDGAPGYYAAIKKPMDLGTIRTKLEKGEYTTYQQMDDDIRLMLNNCFAYNGPGTFVHNEGLNLESVLEKELLNIKNKEQEKRREKEQRVIEENTTIHHQKEPSPPPSSTTTAASTLPIPSTPSVIQKSPSPSLPKSPKRISSTISQAPVSTSPSKPTSRPPSSTQPSPSAVTPTIPTTTTPTIPKPQQQQQQPQQERKPEKEKTWREKCIIVLAKTMENKHAFEFLRPVDPVKQNIPHYFSIIKKPIDLGTIKGKLKMNKYSNAQEFDDDLRLMFANCYQFNLPGTYVYDEARALEEVYNREWASQFNGHVVRKPTSLPKPKEKTSLSSIGESTTKAKATTTTPTPTNGERPKTPVSSMPTPPQLKKTTPVQQVVPKKSSPKTSSTSHPVVPKAAATTAATTATTTSSSSLSKQQRSNKKESSIQKQTATPTSTTNGTLSNKPKQERPAIRERMDDDNIRRCIQIVKKIWDHPAAVHFYDPVDVEGLNLPQYYDVVKRPMDLNSVKRNLEGEEFSTIWEVERDIRQIFWNSYLYNDVNAWINEQARELEDTFNKVWCAEFGYPNRLQGKELELVRKVVTKLSMHDASPFFNEPVDLDSLPDYGRVVKHPMDLRTIWEKVESGKYTSLAQVDADIRLVFSNCFAYNKVGTFAYEQGKKLEKYYNSNIGKELRHRVKEAMASSASATGSSSPASTTTTHPVTPTTPKHHPTTPKHATTPKPKVPSTPKRPTSPLPISQHSSSKPPSSSSSISKASIPSPRHQPNIDKRSPLKPSSPSPAISTISATNVPKPSTSIEKSASSSLKKQKHAPTATATKKPPPKSESATAPASTKRPSSASNAMPQKIPASLVTKCNALITKLKNNTASFAFLQPVDPIALNVPHYPIIVKKPMDLSTVEKKLKGGEYKRVKDFESDIRLIFTNCFTFNGFDHPVSQNAKVLEKVVNKEIPPLKKKEEQLLSQATTAGGLTGPSGSTSGSSNPSTPIAAPSVSSSPSQAKKTTSKKTTPKQGPSNQVKAELRKYKAVLDKLQNHPSYYAFSAPVDPVLLQIPTYFEVIEHPMDFGTIRQKLEKNQYQDTNGLLKDAQQVFINCFIFNLPDDIVTQMGRDVEAEFNKLCAAKNLKGIPISNPPHMSITHPQTTVAPSQQQQQQQQSSSYDPEDHDQSQKQQEMTSTTFDSTGVSRSFDQNDSMTSYNQDQYGYDIPFDSTLGFDQSDFTPGISLDMNSMGSHKRTLDEYNDDGQGDPSQDYDMVCIIDKHEKAS
ncbi:hypothetical protein INT45_010166, partial [Circinella minor]